MLAYLRLHLIREQAREVTKFRETPNHLVSLQRKLDSCVWQAGRLTDCLTDWLAHLAAKPAASQTSSRLDR